MKRYVAQLAFSQGDHRSAKSILATLAESLESGVFPLYGAADLHYLQGRLSEAELKFDDAVANYQQVIDLCADAQPWARDAALARQLFDIKARIRLGVVADRRGDHVRAIESLLRAKRAAEAIGLDQVRSGSGDLVDLYLQLGECYRKTHQTAQATAWLRRGLKHCDQLSLDPQIVDRKRAVTQNALALVDYAAGRFDSAKASLQQTIERLGKTDALLTAECRSNLAWVEFRLKNYVEARRGFQSALDAFQSHQGPDGFRTAECRAYLARCLVALNQVEPAGNAIRQALKSRQSLVNRILKQALSERERLGLIQELRFHSEASHWPGVLDTYLELASRIGESPEDQYNWVLQWKGVVQRDARDAVLRNVDHPMTAKRNELLKELRALARANTFVALAPDADWEPERLERIAELEQEIERVESQLLRHVQTTTPSQTLTSSELARALPDGFALLDILKFATTNEEHNPRAQRAASSYIGFLTRPDGSVERIAMGPPGEAALVDSLVLNYLKEVGQQAAKRPSGARLAEMLRATLKFTPHLRGLIVTGDGMLMRLPFGILPKPDGGYWLEDRAFAYALTAQSFVNRRQRKSTGGRVSLLMAGVDYGPSSQPASSPGAPRGLRANVPWPKLASTTRELIAVRRHFAARRSPLKQDELRQLTGAEATEEALTANLPKVHVAHIATHGFFAEQTRRQQPYGVTDLRDQLDSAIICAGANLEFDEKQGEDQYLTALEISELDLSNLEHLVLSACQTGLGHVSEGQGLVGLIGALDRAGVRTTISALWEVPDRATRELMDAYYGRLLSSGQPEAPIEALRQAQLKMLASDRYFAPSHWGAWIVTGDPFRRPGE